MMQTLLQNADIHVNGDRPWDIQVHTPRLAKRIFAQGTLGLGEAYMDGDWDVDNHDAFFFRILRARVDRQVNPLCLCGMPRVVGS
jgi:cyclopropane-fatty-acyl-phospholipid synthase